MANLGELEQSVYANDLRDILQPGQRNEHRFTASFGLANILRNLAAQTDGEFISKELVDDALSNDGGLRAVLALNGFSMASLAKVVHFARTGDDESVRRRLRVDDWNIPKHGSTTFRWDADRIERQLKEDAAFRAGMVMLFYEGVTISVLHDHIPPHEMKKLSIARMSFEPFSIVETLVDYALYYERTQSIGEALQDLCMQLES